MALTSRAFDAKIAEQQAELNRLLADAFRRGFTAGRDYEQWVERSSNESIRPDTRNPHDGKDETDLADTEGGAPA